MKAKIKAISYYLPEKVLTNAELVKAFPEWSVEKVANKIGIAKRHISAINELASDMAIKAAEKLFLEHNIDRSSIDFILLCTQSPDYYLPTSSCLIQDKLGIPTTAGAFDYNLGCSGFVYGLAVAKGLIKGKIAKNVLLLTSETYTKYIHEGDKSNRTIFGDAAAATLVSTSGFASIEKFDLGTDGKGAENLIVKKGSLRNTDIGGQVETDEFGNTLSPDHLFMNGGEIFNFTIDAVPKLMAHVLEKNKIKEEGVDLFVFHQANKYMLNYLRKMLNIEEEKFYYFMENVGNTVSSTIPIALYEAMKEKKIKEGSNVLLAGFGVGYSWGGTLLKF
jgi:3-oxoacyl-[acyl-carrier-protein] synthase-3